MAHIFGLFATHFFTNFRWDEPRFETNNTVKEDQWTPIDLQFMNQLWVPNIFIYDLRRLQDTSKPTASIFAKSEIECTIYGANLYLMKLKLNFDFYFYFLYIYKQNFANLRRYSPDNKIRIFLCTLWFYGNLKSTKLEF